MNDTRRITIRRLAGMKSAGDPISMLTAYDASFARVLDRAGVECILVGDSLGNVVQGRDSTLPVTLDHMVYHVECVRRGTERALLIGDLPFLTYPDPDTAVASARALMRDLRDAHYRLWYDRESIHAGDNWKQAINRGIDSCDALIVGLTREACKSEYVRYEVQRALDRDKPVFPVKLAPIDESNDPAKLGLDDIQFIDFDDDWDAALDGC